MNSVSDELHRKVKQRVYRYPFPVRAWHWTQAFFVVVLIVTGMQLQTPALGLLSNHAAAAWHKCLGFFMVASFIFWLCYCLLSGRFMRDYIPTIDEIRSLRGQFSYHLFLRQGRHPVKTVADPSRFSPLQKLAYVCVMTFLTPLSIITGVLFSNIERFFWVVTAMGGLDVLDRAHVVTGYCLFLFVIVHIFAASMSRPWWSRYRAMVTGSIEVEEKEE